MSAPLYTLIADELGISDAQAKKFLSAMLKEIRKRAQTGVRLPDLGKFKKVDGQLQFEPSESLARAVNHRFEGLDEEDLASAPVKDDVEEEDNQGPSTITLGYQDSNWSPLESSETESTSSDEVDEDGADTAEFQVPDADEAADTEELQVDTEAPSASKSADSSRNESSSPRSSSTEPHEEPDTEELYPLVEDDSDDPTDTSEPSSDTPNTTAPTSEEEHDSLSGIWDSDDDEELESSPAYDAEPSSSVEPSGSAATDSFSFEEEQPDREGTGTSAAPADSPSSRDRSKPSPDRSNEKSSSSAPRIFVSLLVLLLLGGGAWYILGQRGLVPTPRTTFAQLSTTVQSLTAGAPSSSTESPPPDTGTTASTDPSAEESTSQSGDAPAQSSGSSSPSNTQSAASADSIDPGAGGWSIIVASRAESDAAESLAQTYRDRFGDQNVPVDVIEGTVNNSTRYRVGIGQFDSQSDAQNFLQNFDSELPDGAWSLSLQ